MSRGTIRGAALVLAVAIAAAVAPLRNEQAADAAVAAHAKKPPKLRVAVYVLDFDPIVNGQPLTRLQSWNDPGALQPQYIADVSTASGGTVTQRIAHTSVIRTFPAKPGSFVFTPEQYLSCLGSPSPPPTMCSNLIDYGQVLNTAYDPAYPSACDAIAAGKVDEIWLWGGPWFGYLEYRIVDPASLCPSVSRRFVVMGFSYERGVPEMVHDLGHRAEALVQQGIGITLWDRFDGQRERYGETFDCPPTPDGGHPEVADPSNTHAGNVHFPPNAYCHYQYDRTLTVMSDADDWANFPNLTGAKTPVNAATWGATQEGFLVWWLGRFPRHGGSSSGVFNDWWRYVFPTRHAKV